MKKVILKYGILAGSILSFVLVITQPLFRNGVLNLNNGVYVGVPSTLIAMSVVFFGIKRFRDHHRKGQITFIKAFVLGSLIVLLAAVIHGLTWEVYHNLIAPDFIEWFQNAQVEKLIKEGTNESELIKAREEMDRFAKLYKNPWVRFGFTLTETIPLGLLITLISAWILRKKEIPLA
ncbi:MAG: DUF4199 domain-containing protein [Cyclobacteriaceae bacterium]|nr:DUF4199 domain-containing protein [Cyclobacteriaceae bacterium]